MKKDELYSLLFGFSIPTYYNWKREKRPIINLLNRYFADKDLHDFLENDCVDNLKLFNKSNDNSDSKEFELFKQFLEFQDYKNSKKGNKMQLIIDEEVCTGIGKDNQGIELSIQLNSFGFSGRWKYDKEEEIEIYHLKKQSFEISNEHFISLCELTKEIAIDIEISSGNIFIN